uniref:Uncharacterized protein n=1 Tax=Lotus japonicus TaxID=34305 RepID=I3SLJ3_LOTJA|nr:unknown [Lotus japonicus]
MLPCLSLCSYEDGTPPLYRQRYQQIHVDDPYTFFCTISQRKNVITKYDELLSRAQLLGFP